MIKIRYVPCVLLAMAGATAFADANRQAVTAANKLNPPRVYTGIYQPHGNPTKSSGFAPRPSRAGRRVYGAPIQKPIFKMQPQKPAPVGPKIS